jgi:hypothetical protein
MQAKKLVKKALKVLWRKAGDNSTREALERVKHDPKAKDDFLRQCPLHLIIRHENGPRIARAFDEGMAQLLLLVFGAQALLEYPDPPLSHRPLMKVRAITVSPALQCDLNV